MEASSSGYVYLATSEGLARTYVGVSRSLLDMEWIAKFGVDNLVWFAGYSDIRLAEARADELGAMPEAERQRLILKGNPTQADLSPRIWGE